MKQWTFGVCTGGDKSSVDELIISIDNLHINSDDYEIIVVGGDPINHSNVIHVPFDETVKHIWLTKKKQMICERAKYENVVLMHDYIRFMPDWYNGWHKYNDNDWDVAMNVILNGDGTRFRDWISYGELSLIPYDIAGYQNAQYISGSYWVAKKQFMLEHSLDLKRGWCQAEDIEWSLRCRGHWNYKMNPHSTVKCARWKENWGAGSVGDAIQYPHLVDIINAECDIKVSDKNGHIVIDKDNAVRSIHYNDFDMIRNEIRSIKPKKILSIGDPSGITSFAAAWAASEIDSEVTVADYADHAYGLIITRFMKDRFNWQHINPVAISSYDDLDKQYDMIIMSGTYDLRRKLDEIELIDNISSDHVAIYADVSAGFNDEFKQALGNGQIVGTFYKVSR